MNSKIYLARECIDKICKALVNKTNAVGVGAGYHYYNDKSEEEDTPELVQMDIEKGVLTVWFGTWENEPAIGPDWYKDEDVKVLKDLSSDDIYIEYEGITVILAPYGHRLCRAPKEE